jgi:hypothetical protein
MHLVTIWWVRRGSWIFDSSGLARLLNQRHNLFPGHRTLVHGEHRIDDEVFTLHRL